MAYIPKSKLKFLSTFGNEYIIKSSGDNYIGDFMETSQGLYYAGTNNNDFSVELLKSSSTLTKNQNVPLDKDVVKYNIFKKDILKFLSKTQTPPFNKQRPTEKDYEIGYYNRYFCKKINDEKFIEIVKEVYDGLISKDKKYDYNLYESGQIRWHIKGNVFKLNSISIRKVAKFFPNIAYAFPLLNEFLLPTINVQENLYTQGGELYYSNGTEYIGDYHIHPTVGPMVGAIHTGVEHSKLYYTPKLPKPNGLDYEDWLSTQPLPPSITPGESQIIYIEFNDDRYFTRKFIDDYSVGQIIYRDSFGKFFHPYNNKVIQPGDPIYYTDTFIAGYEKDNIRLDDIRKQYYATSRRVRDNIPGLEYTDFDTSKVRLKSQTNSRENPPPTIDYDVSNEYSAPSSPSGGGGSNPPSGGSSGGSTGGGTSGGGGGGY